MFLTGWWFCTFSEKDPIPTNPKKMTGLSVNMMTGIIVGLVVVVITVPTVWILVMR